MCILIEHDDRIFHVKLYINNDEGKLFQKMLQKRKRNTQKLYISSNHCPSFSNHRCTIMTLHIS